MIKKNIMVSSEFLDELKEKINESDYLSIEFIAEKMGQDEETIKELLRGEIREISIQNAILLIMAVENISEQEALKIIEDMISDQIDGQGQVLRYEDLDKLATVEEYKKIIDSVNKGYMKFFNFNPKLAYIKLNDINANMGFDLGLMISLMSLDYERLAMCPVEKRKELIDKVDQLIDTYSKER